MPRSEDETGPEVIADKDLDHVQGGGVFGTPAGGWGLRPADPGYIGETEKNVRKATSSVLRGK
ncbi:MAG: hypothetical protein AAF409_20570 [Pseudomonadota bacterium]